ncbi:MAG: tRNA (adenosine(37)-N6)-dimethylallyltransferase MiaA [Sphingomonadaceae bacterium]
MSTSNPPEKAPLALIAGPTASGKSDLAVQLAQRLEADGRRAVVLNADSAQVYADLRILSARPKVEDMGGIEHRLFGTWDGAQPCSAADWAKAAREDIATLHEQGAVPILVGGTGMYLRTLLEGIAPVPPIDPDIRAEVRALDQGIAYEALGQEDPHTAIRIAAADQARTMRALEVIRSTGRPLSEWQKQMSGGIGESVSLHPLILLPPREWLYERCDRRFAAMLDEGAQQEVSALLQRNLDPDLPVMRAIGVREIVGLIAGDSSAEEALAAGQQATRRYAKRQYTWFSHQPPKEWLRVESDNYSNEDYFVSLLRKMG